MDITKKKNYPVLILSNRSTLFLALSNWWSMLFRDFSWQSTLLRDLSIWSNDILNFSSLSALLNWFFSFSGLSVLCLGFSLLSVLFLETSNTSVLFRGGSYWSVLLLELYLCEGDFSTVDINFLRCLMYSGYCSRLQWFPPLIHSGSYFSLHSSQSCFPWEQSTTSSEVPYWKMQKTNSKDQENSVIEYRNISYLMPSTSSSDPLV